MGNLNDKVAVVTGASKGIGAAIARHLAAAGATVVVGYASSKEGAEKTVADIVARGGKAVAVKASVPDEAEIAALFDTVKKKYGRIDILVNNAGVYEFSPLETVTVEHYSRQFNTNVLGVLLTTRAALPLFPSSGGSVVNLSSVVSTLAPPMSSVYSGTKGAIDSITRSLAKELAPRKIRVNAVNPGLVNTEGTSGFAGGDFGKEIVAITPLGRIGEPDDIAPPVVFLASEDARWITGETLYVSGGAGV